MRRLCAKTGPSTQLIELRRGVELVVVVVLVAPEWPQFNTAQSISHRSTGMIPQSKRPRREVAGCRRLARCVETVSGAAQLARATARASWRRTEDHHNLVSGPTFYRRRQQRNHCEATLATLI